MSRRSKKRNKEKREAKKAEAESPPRRPFAVLRRRRVLLAALAGLITMVLIAVMGGRQPPRITVVNTTAEPVDDFRVEFPGGTARIDPVPPGEKGSVVLRPDPANRQRPGSGPITIVYRVGTQQGRIVSRLHAQDYGTHDIITISVDPGGRITATPSPPGGGGVSFRDILRRVGIRL